MLIVGLKKERKERGGEKGGDMTESRWDERKNREEMKGRCWMSRRPNKGSRWEESKKIGKGGGGNKREGSDRGRSVEREGYKRVGLKGRIPESE